MGGVTRTLMAMVVLLMACMAVVAAPGPVGQGSPLDSIEQLCDDCSDQPLPWTASSCDISTICPQMIPPMAQLCRKDICDASNPTSAESPCAAAVETTCACACCVAAVAVLPWWTLITACDMWRAPGDFDEIRSREAAFLSCAGDADGAAVCGCSTEYQAVQTVSGACGLTPRLQLRLMFAGCACTYCQPAGVAQRVEADRRVAVGADFVRRRRRCFCAAAHC